MKTSSKPKKPATKPPVVVVDPIYKFIEHGFDRCFVDKNGKPLDLTRYDSAASPQLAGHSLKITDPSAPANRLPLGVEPVAADWPKVGERIAIVYADTATEFHVLSAENGKFLLRNLTYGNIRALHIASGKYLQDRQWIRVPEQPAKRGFWSKLFGGAE